MNPHITRYTLYTASSHPTEQKVHFIHSTHRAPGTLDTQHNQGTWNTFYIPPSGSGHKVQETLFTQHNQGTRNTLYIATSGHRVQGTLYT